MQKLIDRDCLAREDIALAGPALLCRAVHPLCHIAHINEIIHAECERNRELAAHIHAHHFTNARHLEIVRPAARTGMRDHHVQRVALAVKHVLSGCRLGFRVCSIQDIRLEMA